MKYLNSMWVAEHGEVGYNTFGNFFKRCLYNVIINFYTLLKAGIFYFVVFKNVEKFFIIRFGLVHFLASLGYYEGNFLGFISKLVEEGDVAVDIGANAGVYTSRLSKQVGSSGKVVAIEPNEHCVKFLRYKFKNLSNVEIIQCAINSCDGDAVPFYVPVNFSIIQETTTGSILNDNSPSDNLDIVLVKMKALDSFIDKFEKLNFIKVDIEGCEYAFLEGAKKIITHFRPIIQIEAVGDVEKINKIADYAKEIHYSLRRLDNNSLVSFDIVKFNDLNLYMLPNEKLNQV